MGEIESKNCKTCGRVFASAKDFLKGTSRWRLCAEKNLWFNCACGSTLFLLQGKFSWYSPSQGLSAEAANVLNDLSHKTELPYIKSTVFQLQELLAKEDVNLSEVAKILRGDPLLVSEVISMASNLKAARGGPDRTPMESLKHAVAYIGIRSLSDMVTVAALKVIKVKTKFFDIEKFWSESFSNAVIAESLCRKFAPYQKIEDAYLAGFLCNIGKVVSAHYFPEEVDRLAEAVNDPRQKGTWLDHEKQNDSLIDHTVLGEIACAFWGLSPKVLDAVMKHHSTKFEKTPKYPIHEVIALANQMGHWARLEPGRIDTKQLELLATRFKLTDEGLDALGIELSAILENF